MPRKPLLIAGLLLLTGILTMSAGMLEQRRMARSGCIVLPAKDGEPGRCAAIESPKGGEAGTPGASVEHHTRVSIESMPPVSNDAQAQAAVDQLKATLNLGRDDGLQVGARTADNQGHVYYHIQQSYRGLPVYGEVAVLEVAAGRAQALTGRWTPGIDIGIAPRLSAHDAIRTALIREGHAQPISIEFLNEAKLVIFMQHDAPLLCWLASIKGLTRTGVLPPELVIATAGDGVLVSRTGLVLD